MNHKHDCESCKFVKSMTLEKRQVDWYVCKSVLGFTVVGRYGSNGPEYWSLPIEVLKSIPAEQGSIMAREARKIIEELGL